MITVLVVSTFWTYGDTSPLVLYIPHVKTGKNIPGICRAEAEVFRSLFPRLDAGIEEGVLLCGGMPNLIH